MYFSTTPPPLIGNFIRSPITNFHMVPIELYPLKPVVTYGTPRDPLHDDPNYQKQVIRHITESLTEKWLGHSDRFTPLLDYFSSTKENGNCKVTLIENLSAAKRPSSSDCEKYVFRFIEKHFINKKVVRKAIEEYMRENPTVKWFDIWANGYGVKKTLAKQLEKNIRRAIKDIKRM